AIAVLEERVAIRPIEGRGQHGELITTLGFAVLLAGTASLLFGTDPLRVPFMAINDPVTLLAGRVLPDELAIIVLGCSVALGAELVTRRTNLGLTSLATAEDRVAA